MAAMRARRFFGAAGASWRTLKASGRLSKDSKCLRVLLPCSVGSAALLMLHQNNFMCEERPRVALITGSSSGIGKAIAERLAAEGFLVVVNSHSSVEDGKAVAAELPGAMYIQADCSTRQGCEALVKEVIDRCGQLDLLVCNAGVGKWIPHDNLELIDDAYLHKIFALNCFGPLWLSRAAMPHLKSVENSSIIMIGSAAGGRPMGSSIPYSMTRAAMNHLTKLLAKSHGPVRVNCVAPGVGCFICSSENTYASQASWATSRYGGSCDVLREVQVHDWSDDLC
ncbi:unnamed protein product [Durusdinium trenchii]|uniref:Uncharacterized protein n=1 Tax=Durusdinium trenchii TaxID=1381693 RepID=A0ABP0KSF3_9DINO